MISNKKESEDDLINDSFSVVSIKRYFFIDYENVNKDGLNGILKLTSSDCVRIYYSDNAQTLTFGLHRRIIASSARFEFSKVTLPIKNAIDCQILFDIKDIYRSSKAINFYIISKDTDFDKPIEEYKKIGIKIKKLIQICDVNSNTAVSAKAGSNTQTSKTVSDNSREQSIRSAFGRRFNVSPYKENKEAIIDILLNSKDRQSLNNAFTRLFKSDYIPALREEFKDIISSLPSGPDKSQSSEEILQKEQKIKSIYGTYFKTGVYKEKRNEIINILVNGKSRLEINNSLNKIIPNQNVSELQKQFKPILSQLPGK